MSTGSILGKRKAPGDITGRDTGGGGVTVQKVQDMIDAAVISAGAVTETQVRTIFGEEVTSKNLVDNSQAKSISNTTTNEVLSTKDYRNTTQVNDAIANYATTQNLINRTTLNSDLAAKANKAGDETWSGTKTFTGKSRWGSSNPPNALVCLGGGAGADGTGGVSQLEFQYGFTGGYRHYIKTCHDGRATPLENKMQFYVNTAITQDGSSAPGNGNALGLEVRQTGIQVPTETNQVILGAGSKTVTLNSPAPTSAVVYTIPDVKANASVLMSEGNQTVNGTKTFTNAIGVGSSVDPTLGLLRYDNGKFQGGDGQYWNTLLHTDNNNHFGAGTVFKGTVEGTVTTDAVVANSVTVNGHSNFESAEFTGGVLMNGNFTMGESFAGFIPKLTIAGNSSATQAGSFDANLNTDELRYRNNTGWEKVAFQSYVDNAVSSHTAETKRTRGNYFDMTSIPTYKRRLISFLTRYNKNSCEPDYYKASAGFYPPMDYLWCGVESVQAKMLYNEPNNAALLRVKPIIDYKPGSTVPMVRYQDWLHVINDPPRESGEDDPINGIGGVKELKFTPFFFTDDPVENPGKHIDLVPRTNTGKVVSTNDLLALGDFGALYIEIEWWEPAT